MAVLSVLQGRRPFDIETLDLPWSEGARESQNILPFFVTLEDISGESVDLLSGSSVLEDFPHTKKSKYILFGMSIFIEKSAL